MSQTLKQSLIESVANTATGFAYAMVINYLLIRYPVSVDLGVQAFWMTVWFTLASLVRQFFVRRFFDWYDNR